MNTEEKLELRQKINKLLFELDYDLSELDRVKSQIEYVLETTIDSNATWSLIDKLLTLAIARGIKKTTKRMTKKHNLVQEACSNDNLDSIHAIIYGDYNIFTMRSDLADNRYELIKIIESPACNAVSLSIIKLYKLLQTETLTLKNLVADIKFYLDRFQLHHQ